jgi:hypothetical protein
MQNPQNTQTNPGSAQDHSVTSDPPNAGPVPPMPESPAGPVPPAGGYQPQVPDGGASGSSGSPEAAAVPGQGGPADTPSGAPLAQGRQQETERSGTADQETAAAKDYRKQSERFKKEREIIKAREVDTNLSKRLGVLAMPFMFIAILVLIVVFIFIPYATEIAETRDNTRALMKDIKRNEEKIDILTNIDLAELEQRLEVTSTVVRDSMDVTEMAIEVERLALKHNLEPRRQSTSNLEDVVMEATTIDVNWVPSYADVISGPFNYQGSFTDVTAFLKDLRKNSKTILSLGQIRMSRVSRDEEGNYEISDDDYWGVNLLVSGYTAEPVTTAVVADPVRTEVDMVILEQIYSRAGKSLDEDSSVDEADGEENGDTGEE